MAVDFKWLTQKPELLKVSLDTQALEMLTPAFEELEKKSGLRIDPYSNTRISPDHSRVLHQIILKCSPSVISARKDFVEMLDMDNSWWILAVGD